MASNSRLLTDSYTQLVDDTRGALATVDSAELTSTLHTSALNLGTPTHTHLTLVRPHIHTHTHT